MHREHDASVGIFAQSTGNDCGKCVVKRVHMNHIVAFAQQAGEAHGRVDVGNAFQRQD